jgi:hypothetical protein
VQCRDDFVRDDVYFRSWENESGSPKCKLGV